MNNLLPEELPPQIIDAAMKLEMFFQNKGAKEWELMGVKSRTPEKVCNWKTGQWGSDGTTAECTKQFVSANPAFKFCPYCGGRIERITA